MCMYVPMYASVCVCLFVYVCVSLSLFVCKLKHLKKASMLVQADNRVPWLGGVDPWTMTASVGLPWWNMVRNRAGVWRGGGRNQDEAKV